MSRALSSARVGERRYYEGRKTTWKNPRTKVLRVDYVLRIASQECLRIIDSQAHQPRPSLFGCPRNVRRYQAVLRRQQRIVGGRRFRREDIHACASQPSCIKRIGQILVHKQRTTGVVQQEGRWLHQRKSLSVDEALSFREERAVQTDHVRGTKQLFQAHPTEAFIRRR